MDNIQIEDKSLPSEFLEVLEDCVASLKISIEKYDLLLTIGARYDLDEKTVLLIVTPYLLEFMTKRQVQYFLQKRREKHQLEDSSIGSQQIVQIDTNKDIEQTETVEEDDEWGLNRIDDLPESKILDFSDISINDGIDKLSELFAKENIETLERLTYKYRVRK